MIDRSNQRWPRPQTDGLQIPPQNNQKLPRPEWGTLGQMGGQPESGRMPEVRPYDPGRGSPWTMDGLRPTNLPSGARTMTGGGGTFLPGEMDPAGGSPLVAADTRRSTTTGSGVPPGAKTDQWSGPGAVTQRGNFGNLEGFDANNFGDDNMQTAKYQAGRILSRFDPNNPQVLASILADPEFVRMFPRAKGVGPDKIDFGDGRPVDVIRGHGAPGAKFSWQTMDGSGGAAARPATARYAPMMPSEAPMDIWTNAAMAPTMTPEDYALRTNRSALLSARRS